MLRKNHRQHKKLHSQAYLSFDAGDLQTADDKFAELAKAHPDNAQYRYMLGLAAKYRMDWALSLQANLAAISQRLQQAQSEASRQLAQADELPVLLLTPRVQALATALQLEPVPWKAPEKDEDLPAALQKAIQAHRPRAILSHTAPDEAVAQAIAAAGVPLIVLRDNAPDPVQALTDAMLAVAQAMARK